MSQYRLNLFIQPEHAKRLEELAAKKGVSVVHCRGGAASWHRPMLATSARRPSPSGSIACRGRPSAWSATRNIQIETLALFIRYFLTVSTPIPEAHQGRSSRQGKARFEQFVEWLGRHLPRGRSPVRDVVEEPPRPGARMDDAGGTG